MQNNIFLGGADPLLGGSNYSNIESQMAELQRMQQALEAQKQSMIATQQQMNHPTNQIPILVSWISDNLNISTASLINVSVFITPSSSATNSNNISTALSI